MKFERNTKYTTIAIYAFLVIAASILFFYAITNFFTLFDFAKSLLGFVQPVIYGVVIAYLLNPMLRIYDNKLLPLIFKGKRTLKPKTSRSLGIALTYLTALTAVAGFIIVVVPELVSNIQKVFDNFPYYLQNIDKVYRQLTNYFSDLRVIDNDSGSGPLINDILDKASESLTDILKTSLIYLEEAVPVLIQATTRLTTEIINVVLGIIISIYILCDREKLFAQTKKICAAFFSTRTNRLLKNIGTESHRVFSRYIIGTIIDSVAVGILCFIGMSILRLPYPALISFIVGVTNVIPYFGPFIGAVPGALIIFVTNPYQALWFLIFILLLQQFDGNIMNPKIVGEATGLAPLWVVFAIMFFSGLFGILGMFIGVPLFGVLYMIIKKITAYILEQKGKSSDTKDYASEKNKLL